MAPSCLPRIDKATVPALGQATADPSTSTADTDDGTRDAPTGGSRRADTEEHPMRRTILSTTMAALVLLAGALPAMAGGERSVRFSWSDSYTVQHDCGIVESATVEVRGTAHFDASGAWIRDNVGFKYQATYTGPGGSLTNKTNQVGTFTPDQGALRAQGTFIHGGHIGTVVHDVGRLVFDMADGSTLFATPKVIPLDDPDALTRIDQALCDLIG
jgi:hypothetical protein